MVDQPGVSSIKINWWCVIFQQINGISLCVGEAEMKICKRSLQALLSSSFCSFAARSNVLSRLSSLAIHGGVSGGMLPQNILKSQSLNNRFPAFIGLN